MHQQEVIQGNSTHHIDPIWELGVRKIQGPMFGRSPEKSDLFV